MLCGTSHQGLRTTPDTDAINCGVGVVRLPTITRRRSAAYFHDGNADAVISALATCVAPGDEPLYAPITVTEHIAAKLAGSRAGQLNTAAEREAARVLAANG